MRAKTIFFVFLLLASLASAQNFYADIEVNVDETGSAFVSGLSNHPSLSERQTDEFTSKNAGVWLFNLSVPEGDLFSDYVYSVTLPPGAQVNYVKTTEAFRITSEGNRIRVSGAGSGELGIVIQYRIESVDGSINTYILPLLALLAFVLVVLFFRHGKDSAPEPLEEIPEQLTQRQKAILRFVSESERPVNQTAIGEVLDIPKSSVSRNINSLERLGLVEKTRTGMSTYISLKK